MNRSAFTFVFDKSVPLADAEQTLHLALYSVEGLHGPARVRLEAGYHTDEPRRLITVDASNEVGSAIVQVYTGLLLREFGEAAFDVRRVPDKGAEERSRAAGREPEGRAA